MDNQGNRLSIGRINGVEIFAVKDEDNQVFVPVKPLCEAIGVAYERQYSKVKEHPILNSVITLRVTTGADGKQYEMVCLPHEFIYGWIFTINPKNVSEGARDNVVRYQKQCYKALYDYFNGKSRRQQDLLDAEHQAVARLNDIDERIRESDNRTKELKAERAKAKSDIDNIRASRLDDQPSLFD